MQVYAYTFKNELTSLCWNYLGDVQNELDKFYDLGLDGYFADYPNTVSFLLFFLGCAAILLSDNIEPSFKVIFFAVSVCKNRSRFE